MELDPVPIVLQVSAMSGGLYAYPSHAAASLFRAPSMTWDGGDENTL